MEYGVCIGVVGKNQFLDLEDVDVGKAQVPLSVSARKAKFVGILPQSNDPLYIVLIRPGDADSSGKKKNQTSLLHVINFDSIRRQRVELLVVCVQLVCNIKIN